MQIGNSVFLVTGGASGLGAATARMAAANGAKVMIADLQAEAGEMLAKELGGRFCKCDVTSEADGKAAVEAAVKAFGGIHVLVNCAGIGVAERTLGKEAPHDLARFTKVVTINLIGTFNMIRLAANDMQALEPLADGERGVIVSTASVAAFEGQIGQAAYSASKGGVAALTLPAAREFARMGVRVLTIAPGIFATPMLRGMPQAVQDSLAASIPFPARLGTPEDYAKLVLHIVDNVMLNGEVIRLDGAIRMQPK